MIYFQENFLLQSGNVLNFNNYDDLYDFWTDAMFKYKNYNEIVLQQVNFLKDLMNGYRVCKRFVKFKYAKDLYLELHANAKITVHDIFLKNPTDKYKKENLLTGKNTVWLREKFFKKLLNKGIIKSDSDLSNTEYEESIKERIKSRRQKLDEIKEKEQNINKELFKKYFHFQTPTAMLKSLYNLNGKKSNALLVRTIKSGLIDLKNKIEKMSEDQIDNEEPYEIVGIAEEMLDSIEKTNKKKA